MFFDASDQTEKLDHVRYFVHTFAVQFGLFEESAHVVFYFVHAFDDLVEFGRVVILLLSLFLHNELFKILFELGLGGELLSGLEDPLGLESLDLDPFELPHELDGLGCIQFEIVSEDHPLNEGKAVLLGLVEHEGRGQRDHEQRGQDTPDEHNNEPEKLSRQRLGPVLAIANSAESDEGEPDGVEIGVEILERLRVVAGRSLQDAFKVGEHEQEEHKEGD